MNNETIKIMKKYLTMIAAGRLVLTAVVCCAIYMTLMTS
jgi:hypothetical protein